MRVLIIDVDERRARERADDLLMEGHQVQVATAATQAKLKLAQAPDALVLSSLATGPETIALLRQLRAGELPRTDPSLPVLVLGADSDADQVRYYQAGADIALPSRTPALVLAASLKALARRASSRPRRQIRVANLTLDCDARTAEVDGQALGLTRLEYDLLQTLARQPHKTFTRAELTQQVWGYDPKAAGPSRTIDSHSSRLRQKLAQAGAGPLIHTLRGVGWRLTR